jgi:hypothetical protein
VCASLCVDVCCLCLLLLRLLQDERMRLSGQLTLLADLSACVYCLCMLLLLLL